MNKLKLKTNEKGYCDELFLNGERIGDGITKLELIIEAGKKPNLILTMSSNDVELECEDVNVIKNTSKEETIKEEISIK